MATDQDRLLDHNYDGIQEYDNPLPGWWSAIFGLCILFSVGYWAYYHGMGTGHMSLDEYTLEMAQAEAKWPKFVLPPKTESELSIIVADPARVTRGASQFQTLCFACHGAKGEGKIGPNLTDSAWLHGGNLGDLYISVGTGWPAKGMPGWGKQLSPDDLLGVVAFVASLRNTNVPGKPPQAATTP